MNNDSLRFLVLDVDGTLTDGRIYIGPGGELMKAFHVRDGYGIAHLLPDAGITPVVITGRSSEIVAQRCREIGISEVLQGQSDKLKALNSFAVRKGVGFSSFAYMGDDLNDLPCMRAVRERGGRTGCPSDAVAKVKDSALFVSSFKGGEGAVRDFIDWLTS